PPARQTPRNRRARRRQAARQNHRAARNAHPRPLRQTPHRHRPRQETVRQEANAQKARRKPPDQQGIKERKITSSSIGSPTRHTSLSIRAAKVPRSSHRLSQAGESVAKFLT